MTFIPYFFPVVRVYTVVGLILKVSTIKYRTRKFYAAIALLKIVKAFFFFDL